SSNKNCIYYLKLAFAWICGIKNQDVNDNEAAAVSEIPPLAQINSF
ncbi:unnamed protein product, partial [Rotaria magnacalcarata]